MKIRRVLLATYGLLVGAAYAAPFQLATGSEGALLPFRGFFVVVLMGCYGWCCGKDPFLTARRPLAEVAVFPLALLGAAIAGMVVLAWAVVAGLIAVWQKISVA